MPNLASPICSRVPPQAASRRAAVILLGGLAVVGCVIPPGAATIPASGAAGQRRASTTSARKKGENPFQDAYWVLDPDSNAHRTAEQWRATRPAVRWALESGSSTQ